MTELINLDFTATTKPAVLRGGKQSDGSGAAASITEGDDYRYLLMPVRLSG